MSPNAVPAVTAVPTPTPAATLHRHLHAGRWLVRVGDAFAVAELDGDGLPLLLSGHLAECEGDAVLEALADADFNAADGDVLRALLPELYC